ncbi:MAG: GH1 family beta-glucosidase [Clostridiales bacterium]|nr:GH1 family beta-glucosidase [Clostridiales bacterium]
MSFPKDFLWGAATASYQIEGSVYEDGKGLSIWDEFTKVPGAIKDRSSGDVAINHYRTFREDIRLMAEMGIRCYRFSISWPRILPEGTGEVNEKGLNFYSELVDCLLENGIRPFITLYHWDLPSALHHRGGWLNDEMPEWFANYTRVVAQRLGDRCKDFITINEPQCIIGSGYALGVHAPGLKCSAGDIVKMAHNLMLSHGRAVMVLRDLIPGVRVGYAPCGDPAVPYTNTKADIDAAREFYFKVYHDEKVGPAWNIAWFSDPVMLGIYPEDGLIGYEQFLPRGWEKDLEVMHQPLDFYGQNIYQGQVWRAGKDGRPERVPYPTGHPHNALGWPINADALYWGPRFLYERYKTPIIITENGIDTHDAVSLDGKVHDPNRQDYIHRYLLALRRAMEEGVDVQGYFYWSFFDNFEWSHGYNERFGLTYVDYTTQKRILKDSAYWYKNVIETNGECL